ncbi:MAG: ferrous iron transport protein A [Actinobacteria bacterium]|nr:ferrous iron transport protein A [Cyanobacteriota bacterium]MCL6087325.1 ferrous iron transport protein A [Actinomycetota bacterium]
MERKINSSKNLDLNENYGSLSDNYGYIFLGEVQKGGKYRIEKILGGCSLNTRLLSIGFVPGEIVYVLKQQGFGPMTVIVKGTKIAIGRGAANKILVSAVKTEI